MDEIERLLDAYVALIPRNGSIAVDDHYRAHNIDLNEQPRAHARAVLLAAVEAATVPAGCVVVDRDDLHTAVACMRWVRIFKRRTWQERWDVAYERLFAALAARTVTQGDDR